MLISGSLDSNCGELKLAFFLSEDYLEVEIVSARDLPNADSGCPGKCLSVCLSSLLTVNIDNFWLITKTRCYTNFRSKKVDFWNFCANFVIFAAKMAQKFELFSFKTLKKFILVDFFIDDHRRPLNCAAP